MNREKRGFSTGDIWRKPPSPYFKELGIDLVVIGLGSLFIKYILTTCTNTGFRQDLFYLMLVVFLLLNSLLYVVCLQPKLQTIYQNKTSSQKALALLYLLKLIRLVVVVLMLSSNLVLIKESLSFLAQEPFFKEHQNYEYVNFAYLPQHAFSSEVEKEHTDTAIIKQQYYKDHFRQLTPIVLADFGKLKTDDIIIANQNALPYLQQQVPSLKNIKFKNDYYYIFPSCLEGEPHLSSYFDARLENYEDEQVIKNRHILYYEEEANILNINNLLPLGSKISENPIIILDHTRPALGEKVIKGRAFRTSFDRNIMYLSDDKAYDAFIKDIILNQKYIVKPMCTKLI